MITSYNVQYNDDNYVTRLFIIKRGVDTFNVMDGHADRGKLGEGRRILETGSSVRRRWWQRVRGSVTGGG